MKPHKILKTFAGSQTGNDHHVFTVGTVAKLSPDLARIAVSEGWAEPHNADSREMKVIGPEELKIVEPEETKPSRLKDFQETAKKKKK